jgi:hypothetical protein
MPASSKQQQKLMGIVHSIQKGDANASDFSKKAQKLANDMKPSDVKDFASTPTKNLPKKATKESILVESPKINWTEFWTMAKDTDGYNPQFEKKYGYLVHRPHIADALKKAKNFSQFMQIIKPFEEAVNNDCNCVSEKVNQRLTLKAAMGGNKITNEKKK